MSRSHLKYSVPLSSVQSTVVMLLKSLIRTETYPENEEIPRISHYSLHSEYVLLQCSITTI